MKQPLAALAAILVMCGVVIGCGKPQAKVDAQPESEAAAFLKWSMEKNGALTSLRADVNWSIATGTPQDAEMAATRMLIYSKPNKFKIVTTRSSGLQTVVSDGTKSVAYASDKRTKALVGESTDSIATDKSIPMTNPFFMGSQLYQFLGGASRFETLVDTAKGAVSFGAEVTLDGQPCKTVKFVSKGTYGNTEVSIGTKDGLVRQIVFDNAPLLAIAKSQGVKDAPASFKTTETYSKLAAGGQIADSEFNTKLPDGVIAMAAGGDSGPPPLGKPAPEFSVTSLSGQKMTLASLRGKVVLVDFWATWCGPCRKGLPETQKLHEELASKGLAVLAVTHEDKPTVSDFMKSEGFTIPTYLDDGGKMNEAYGVESIPTLAIIDREGKLSSFLVGLHPPEDVREELKKVGL